MGVIGTLVYLSIQIRANTKESRLAATSDISRQYNSYLTHITADKELSSLWRRAIDDDISELSQDDRARAVMMMGNVLRIFENAFTQRESGRMEEQTWQGYEKLIARGVTSSIFPLYWQLRREMHDQRFAELVDRVAKNPDTRKMFD